MEVYLAKIDNIDKTTAQMNETMIAYMQKVDNIISGISQAANQVADNQRTLNQLIILLVILASLTLSFVTVLACTHLPLVSKRRPSENSGSERGEPRCFTIM